MATYEQSQAGDTEAAVGTSAALKPRKKRVNAAAEGEAAIGFDLDKVERAAKAGSTKGKGSMATATKSDTVLKLLRTAKGSTIGTIIQATGWQAHSVRGFMSAVVRKKLNLNLTSEVGKDGQRRYRIDDSARAG